jgi:ATP-dependent DNA helicase RecQ
MCDNCTADEKELSDITIPAQKFLSAVKRTGEIFGAKYIIDILLGNDSDRIISNRHHSLSVYGIGKEFDKKQWQTFVHQFIRKELLTRDLEFGSLKLSEKANNVLFKNEKVLGYVKEPVPSSRKLKPSQAYDHELFELLRKKRKDLADEFNVPPYVIFSDRSLIEMAVNYPRDESTFLNISGVGIRKLESYGSLFLSIIKSYCLRKNIVPVSGIQKRTRRREKRGFDKPKYIIVSESYNDGSSIDDLVKEYDVKPQTIISHLARYANEGNKIRTDELINRLLITSDQKQKVFEEFETEGTVTLKNIYEKFNQEISYEDLNILRIIFLQKRKLSI